MKSRFRALYNWLLVLLFFVFIFYFLPGIIKVKAQTVTLFDQNDPIGVFQNYDNAHSYEYFKVSGGLEYLGGTTGQNCVILGSGFCNAVQFIESANGNVLDEYIFLEINGVTTCQNEIDPFGDLDLGTQQGVQDLLDACTEIARRIGYWPYDSAPVIESGFSSFLGTTTPLSIISDVTGGVQSTAGGITPAMGLVGVPVAFGIGSYLLWFIRRSIV
jgi:hypothetical protein